MDQSLIDAVIDQLGFESMDDSECVETLRDVLNHGADQDVSGFIYYSETHDFYARNQRLIVDHLQDEAESMGMANALELAQSFRCMQDADQFDIAKALVTIDSTAQISNCLAWYALESVARFVCDELEAVA
jgi:hypothetical protein